MRKGVVLMVIAGLILAGCSSRQQGPPVVKDVTLSGLMYTPDGSSLAIINGQTVKVGEGVAGYTVKTIASDHVILTQDGRDYRVEPQGSGGAPPLDVGAAQSLGASRQSDAYSQSLTTQKDDYATQKKKEYLTLALSHEQQAYSMYDDQQALYHYQEAITNYKNALSLETDRVEKTDIELKIQRLEDRLRVVNNRMNQPAGVPKSNPLRRY